jgi:peptidoglycan L-alanyl-D-glutamate endopeptidase CwlK
MASRNLTDLYPAMQPVCRDFLARAAHADIDVLITCTWRSSAEQDALYAQGRSQPGPIVTRARGGQSAHNYMLNGKPAAKAFDVVPIVNGKPMWDEKHPAWQALGKIGTELGLDWYGRPDAKFHEMPHFQLKG